MDLKYLPIKTLAAVGVSAMMAQSAWANHPATGDRVLDLGTLGDGTTVLNQKVAGGEFSDTYNFSLDASVLTADLLDKSAAGSYDIANLSLSFYDSTDTSLFTLTADDFDQFGPVNLAAGDYYAVVSGETEGTHGGMYQMSFNISPVPDAQTWMLMLGGLGLVGLGSTLRNGGRSELTPA